MKPGSLVILDIKDDSNGDACMHNGVDMDTYKADTLMVMVSHHMNKCMVEAELITETVVVLPK